MSTRTVDNTATQARVGAWVWPSWALHAAVVLFYTLIAVLATWPVATRVLSAVAGSDDAVDSYQHIWHQWWVAEALTHGKNPFFTDLLYYPEGIDLFWQTLGFTQGLVALPITLTLGSVAGVNFTVLSSFIIGGYTVFLLGRRLSGSVIAGLVAGTIYVLSPYHLQKMSEGSIELTSIHWLPMYVWALDALLEKPSWRRVLLSAALLLWVGLGAWYYGLFAVMLSGCMIGVRVLREFFRRAEGEAPTPATDATTWQRFRANRWGRSLGMALWGGLPLILWALVLSPKIATVNQSIDQSSWDLRAAQVTHSADLIDFFLPSPIHPLWGEAVRDWRTARFPDLLTYWNVSLGLVGLPLALIGLIVGWRTNWRWGVLLLATMLLAMGPMLRLAGAQTEIPLPFALIQGLPGVRIGQRPSHMAVLTTLMVAILAAYGVARLLHNRGQLPRLLIGAGLITAIILVDGQIEPQRMTLTERKVHPFYATLPAPDGALMALPMYVHVNRIEHMHNQITHRRPIFAGYVARPPAYRYAFETDGVSQLREGRAEPDDIISPAWPESGRRALAAYKIRYVTLDRTTERGDPKLAAGKPEYFAAVRTLLSELGVGPALVADADLEAYAIPRDWPVGAVGALGSGWKGLERQPETNYRWRWMGPEGTMRLFNPFDRPVPAEIRLQLASYQIPRELQIRIDGQPAGTILVGTTPEVQTIALLLPPGQHVVTLTAPADPDPASAGELISVRAFAIDFRFGQPEE
ncbi:MAG: hypothetical protein Fur005_35510 [Roseiflexaceae bacterium]